MNIGERLQNLRKIGGYSQEELAEMIGVSRQTIGKWETGQAMPELSGLIKLSEIYSLPIDRIVKDDVCNINIDKKEIYNDPAVIVFLIRAKKATYAGKGGEAASSRPQSHDLHYSEGDYFYCDTYLGGESFFGEEAVWIDGAPVWSMNYGGVVTGENFSGDFLKNALLRVPREAPYRGPEIYREGEYLYRCKVQGNFEWFQGYEEIFFAQNRIYECFFHGGKVR